MVQEDQAVEKEDRAPEKEGLVVVKDQVLEEDPVEDRAIMPEIICINKRRRETPESDLEFKITGQEICIRVASPEKMPAIPNLQQVTDNPELVQAVIRDRVLARAYQAEDQIMFMPIVAAMFTKEIIPITNGNKEIIIIPGATRTQVIITG